MENRKSREFLRQREDEAAWESVRSTARPADCDVDAPGVGARRLQLIVCSSFEYEDEPAWEIRQLNDEWRLFRSEVVESFPNVQLVDYRRVPVEPAVLASFLSRVAALSLPIAPDLDGMAGVDGETWQLTLYGDMCSECRFQWWSSPPPHWEPLASFAAEMRDAFRAAERRT